MKKAFPYVLLTALLFATLEPVSGNVSGGVHFLTITLVRFLIGGLVLLPFALAVVRRTALHLSRRDFLVMAGLGVFLVCVSMPLLQFAVLLAHEAELSAAVIGILFSANSVFTMLLSALLLKAPLTARRLLGAGVCMVGVVVCSLNIGTVADTARAALSVGMAVISSLTFSLYTVWTRKYAAGIPGLVQLSVSYSAGGALLAVATAVYGATSGVSVFEGVFAPANLPTLLYLGIFVTGIGYWSFFRAIDRGTTLAASFVFFFKPLLNPVVDFVYNRNPSALGVRVLIASLLVVAGSILAVRGAAKPKLPRP